MKRCRIVLVVGALVLLTGALRAQEGKEDPAHDELRKMKAQLVEAVNKPDFDAALTHLDKDVVVTWLDGRVSKGPKEVREYLDRMTKGPDRKVESFKTDPTVDDLTHLYGNTGVAFGSSKDTFKLTDGSDFTVNTRWTATMVKDGGAWKITSLHASTNVFDNEVLSLYLRWRSYLVAAVAGLGGLVVGLLVGAMFRRRSA
jgi:ketosteroid isomerase-like protein